MPAATSPPFMRCFRCQSWGHHRSACSAELPRCGVCSYTHWTETCLARLKRGEKVPPHCFNCGKRHHTWNPRCPARPQQPTKQAAPPPVSKGDLKAILGEFAAGLADLLGVPLSQVQLQQLLRRSFKPPTPAPLLPRPLLLQQKRLAKPVQEAPCGVLANSRVQQQQRKSVSPPAGIPATNPVTTPAHHTSVLSSSTGGSPPTKRRKVGSATQTEDRVVVADAATNTESVTADATTETAGATSLHENPDLSLDEALLTATLQQPQSKQQKKKNRRKQKEKQKQPLEQQQPSTPEDPERARKREVVIAAWKKAGVPDHLFQPGAQWPSNYATIEESIDDPDFWNPE